MDGEDKTTDSDYSDNKDSSNSDSENFRIPRKNSDENEDDQEDKAEIENPDSGMSDTDSKR